MTELLEHALAYATRGWPVLPLHTWTGDSCTCGHDDCPSPAKHPRTKHGLKDATTDPAKIRSWWSRWPTANIGLRTGIAFDVLDVDGDQGLAAIDQLEQRHEPLRAGPTSHTGGGGLHVLYAPSGQGNKAGILDHVDWRGDGGYIVAPPSLHASGRRYRWDDTAGPDTPTQTGDAWLLDLVAPSAPPATNGKRPPPRFDQIGTPYGERALDAELRDLRRAQPGTRNDALNQAAFNLYQLVAGGELDDDVATRELLASGLAIGLHEREIHGTLDSARKGAFDHPRTAAPLRLVDPATNARTRRTAPGTRTTAATTTTSPPATARAAAAGSPTAAPAPDVDLDTDQRWRPVPNQPEPEPDQEPPLDILPIRDIHDVIREVDDAPPVRFIFKPVWAEDAYGTVSAEGKAGKTWAILDAAVSCASGTPWLGHFPVDADGPVLVFVGEGGPRKLVRRLRAITTGRGLHAEQLPIRVCFRVPQLSALDHLAIIRHELEARPRRLVIIDPLYLAAGGAKSSDLIEMGRHLANIQYVAQDAGAALLLVHHWNKTGEGTGAKRMSGVGAFEWGRVLAAAAVLHRRTDPDTKMSTVALGWEFIGDELADDTVKIRRRVWADDPDDLTSALHYETEVIHEDLPGDPSGDPAMTPAAKRILAILEATEDRLTVRVIGDRLADDGKPLKPRTIQTALKQLAERGLARSHGLLQDGTAYEWGRTDTDTGEAW